MRSKCKVMRLQRCVQALVQNWYLPQIAPLPFVAHVRDALLRVTVIYFSP